MTTPGGAAILDLKGVGMAGVKARKRSSIADVARLAEVSVGTVSNALNRPDRVAPKTLERVLAAIKELQFVPNSSARQLRAGSLQTIGAIVLDISNPYFTEVARGIEDRLAEDGFTLMLASSDRDPDREERYLNLFEQHGAQGVILVPSRPGTEGLRERRERGIETVLLDVNASEPDVSSAAVDNVAGAQQAVAHLLDQGHRKIAFINGHHEFLQCRDRHLGAVRAIEAAGLDPAKVLTEYVVDSMTAESGETTARVILARPAGRRPTAIFCINDLVALGVMRVAREQHLSLPGEVAIVGYDDLVFAAELATPLTSVRQPTHQLGYRAAELLIAQLTEGADYSHEHVQFQPELIVRGSSTAQN